MTSTDRTRQRDTRRLRYLYRSSVVAIVLALLLAVLVTVLTVVLEASGRAAVGTVSERSAGGFDIQFTTDSGESRTLGVDSLPDGVASGDEVTVRYAESQWVPPQLDGTPWWEAWPALLFVLFMLISATSYKFSLDQRADAAKVSAPAQDS